MIRTSISCVGAAACLACATHNPAPATTPAGAADPLQDIVGVWQSDTTDGIAARSSCDWTPRHLAVICDQRITFAQSPAKEVTNVFARDDSGFVFYGIPHPGATLSPVPLSIARHVWIYGGSTHDAHGAFNRTVNDFTARDTYTWRAETSADGEHWTVVAHGRSTRVRG